MPVGYNQHITVPCWRWQLWTFPRVIDVRARRFSESVPRAGFEMTRRVQSSSHAVRSVVVAVLLASFAACGGQGTPHVSLHGTVVDLDYNSNWCGQPSDAYVSTGTPYQVLDASGAIIGAGHLGPGAVVTDPSTGNPDCTYTLDTPLDHPSSHYQFVLGSMQPYEFDDASNLQLQITGDVPSS